MSCNWFSIGAVLGLLGVGLGAFGAHGLERVVSEPKALEWWATAVQYHLVHALALLAVGLVERGGRRARAAGLALCVGTLVFSGTLYALALGAPSWFGAITPLGGLALMAGWGLLGLAGRARVE